MILISYSVEQCGEFLGEVRKNIEQDGRLENLSYELQRLVVFRKKFQSINLLVEKLIDDVVGMILLLIEQYMKSSDVSEEELMSFRTALSYLPDIPKKRCRERDIASSVEERIIEVRKK